jgi:hypothetical protein
VILMPFLPTLLREDPFFKSQKLILIYLCYIPECGLPMIAAFFIT